MELSNQQLRAAQVDLEARLFDALAERGSSDVRTRELSQRVAELESQLTVARGYENAVNQLAGQTEDMLAENLALQTALTEARAAPKPPADWQNQRATLTNRIEALQSELLGAQALDATVERLSAANRNLRGAQTDLEAQLADAGVARDAEAKRNRNLNREIADLRRDLLSAQSLQTQIDQLADTRDDLRADNLALQTALSESRAAPKPPADWEQQRQALSTRLESLQSDLQTARSYEQTAGELMTANQALLASQGILEVRIADSDAAFQNASSRADALENRLNELDVLPDQLDRVRGELVTLQGDYETVSAENEALERQVSTAQTVVAQQQIAAQQTLTVERDRMRAEIEQLRQSSDELAGRSSSDQAQVASLLNEVTQARSRIAALQGQLDSATTQSSELNEMNTRLASAESELRSQRTTNSQLQSSLTAERRTHEFRLTTLERENAALNSRLRQAQNTLDQIAAAARALNPNTINVLSTSRPSSPPRTSSVPPTTSAPRTHVVQQGDSLTRISMRYYGTATRWQEIYQANRELLSEANALQPGQRLQIP